MRFSRRVLQTIGFPGMKLRWTCIIRTPYAVLIYRVRIPGFGPPAFDVNQPQWFRSVPDIPILMVSGDQDPVEISEGSRKSIAVC